MRKIGMDLQIHLESFLKSNLNYCLLELLMGQEVEDFWVNILFYFYLNISGLWNLQYNSFLMKDYQLFLKEFKTSLLEKEVSYFYKILIFCHSKQPRKKLLMNPLKVLALFQEESFYILKLETSLTKLTNLLMF